MIPIASIPQPRAFMLWKFCIPSPFPLARYLFFFFFLLPVDLGYYRIQDCSLGLHRSSSFRTPSSSDLLLWLPLHSALFVPPLTYMHSLLQRKEQSDFYCLVNLFTYIIPLLLSGFSCFDALVDLSAQATARNHVSGVVNA